MFKNGLAEFSIQFYQMNEKIKSTLGLFFMGVGRGGGTTASRSFVYFHRFIKVISDEAKIL